MWKGDVMRFKIIEVGGQFYVQRRLLFFWVTEHEELGWNCSAPKKFAQVEDARAYVYLQAHDAVHMEHGY